MNILILEDDRMRQRAFLFRLAGTNTVVVETVPEAIELLKTKAWDYLFLDHDLGGQQYVPSGEDTGYGVALWLKEHPERMPGNIIVHSLNASGANAICCILPTATRAPWCWNTIELRDA